MSAILKLIRMVNICKMPSQAKADEALAELAALEELADATERLYAYRCRNTLNWQMEKADDFFREIDNALRKLGRIEE